MASTQKKTGKKQDNGKKSAPAKKKTPVYEPNNVARGIGAAVCIFLAAMLVLGLLNMKAVVVDFLADVARGLLGYGIWPAVPALLAAAWLLVFRRETSVQLRLWCVGLIPLFFGALLHLVLSPYNYEIAPGTILKLWEDGQAMFSGGLLAGMLSVSLSALTSS